METPGPRTTSTPGTTPRASHDELVWVVLNHVKADKWEQHERFVRDILMPASEKVDPVTHRHIRFLVPRQQNADGTSIFLMDPVLPGVGYNILELLIHVYGEQQSEEHFQGWADTFTGDQTVYEMQQSIW
jgi:hypothetical protein